MCPCCMSEHEAKRVRLREDNIYRGLPVEYDAEYFYCDIAEEYYADEDMMTANYEAMVDAYHISRRAV